jgi:hypothetical protein
MKKVPPNPKRSFIPGEVGSSLPSTKISNPAPMQARELKNMASSATWINGKMGGKREYVWHGK